MYADADAEEGGRRKVSRENVRRKSAGIGAGLLGGGGQKKSGSTVLLNEQRGCDRDRRMP